MRARLAYGSDARLYASDSSGLDQATADSVVVAIAIAIAVAVAVISHVAKIYGFHLLVSHVEANANSGSGSSSRDSSNNNKIEFCPDCARCSRYD